MNNQIKQRVLICDDDKISYSRLRSFLENLDFECDDRIDTEADMRNAISKSYRDRRWYHVILIDYNLSKTGIPGMTGESIYKTMQSEFPDEFYVIYSKYWEDSYRFMINNLMYRKVNFVLLDDLLSEKYLRQYMMPVICQRDPRHVFLVCGRNERKNEQMRNLLQKGFGLDIVTWEHAREETHGRKYLYEIVMKGIEISHVTVVLFTDDEDVRLKSRLRKSGDDTAKSQSRPNVYIEAGYAIGVRQNRTVFVEWPDKESGLGLPSDFAGMHTVRFTDSSNHREILKKRLESTRCLLKPNRYWRTMKL